MMYTDTINVVKLYRMRYINIFAVENPNLPDADSALLSTIHLLCEGEVGVDMKKKDSFCSKATNIDQLLESTVTKFLVSKKPAAKARFTLGRLFRLRYL